MGGGVSIVVKNVRHLNVSRSVWGTDCSSVATHCLLEAVVAQQARRYGLKAILEEEVGNDSTSVCYQQESYEERQRNTGQRRQSCTR